MDVSNQSDTIYDEPRYITNTCVTYMWTPPDGHEGDLVFISGRLFDGIFNKSFQAFFNKIRKEF